MYNKSSNFIIRSIMDKGKKFKNKLDSFWIYLKSTMLHNHVSFLILNHYSRLKKTKLVINTPHNWPIYRNFIIIRSF